MPDPRADCDVALKNGLTRSEDAKYRTSARAELISKVVGDEAASTSPLEVMVVFSRGRYVYILQ